jgi:predicted secreted protein
LFGWRVAADWRRVAVSNFTAIAVMLAINLVAFAVYYAGDKWIHNRSEIVLHGVSSGIPISLRHRRIVLTGAFVPTVAAAVLMLATTALGLGGVPNSSIGRRMPD